MCNTHSSITKCFDANAHPVSACNETGRKRSDGFTLIELLVVISIIAVLASMVLPALAKAKSKGAQIHCLNTQRQLAMAARMYSDDSKEWLPPIQDWTQANGESFRTTWRSYLYHYVARNPRMFDCPAEQTELYSLGKRVAPRSAIPAVVGQSRPGENELVGGIGAVDVHWENGGAPPPFGRPAPGYPSENNQCRWPKIERPSQVIFFGDGHSDFDKVWPEDHWWIWKELGSANSMGFNRAQQKDPGAFRHGGRSNYAFGDGHATLLDPAKIPCNKSACWWSVKASPH